MITNSLIKNLKRDMSHIVCIGGGHCNVQVLKMLKKTKPADAKVTLVTECHQSYYSGMLPGSTASKRES